MMTGQQSEQHGTITNGWVAQYYWCVGCLLAFATCIAISVVLISPWPYSSEVRRQAHSIAAGYFYETEGELEQCPPAFHVNHNPGNVDTQKLYYIGCMIEMTIEQGMFTGVRVNGPNIHPLQCSGTRWHDQSPLDPNSERFQAMRDARVEAVAQENMQKWQSDIAELHREWIFGWFSILFGIACGIFAFLFGVATVRHYKQYRGLRRLWNGLCPKCRYRVTMEDNPPLSVCPECGAKIQTDLIAPSGMS